MDYEQFYDLVSAEIINLRKTDVAENYRLCKVLAACYELQDYLANRIAEVVEDMENEEIP